MKLNGIKALKPWQFRQMVLWFVLVVLVGGSYITIAAWSLHQDKLIDDPRWNMALENTADQQDLYPNATKVYIGSYIENLKEIDIKSSYFRLISQIWFRWEGDPALDMMNHFQVYKGLTNKVEVLKDYHEGTTNYQLIRLDTSITRNFQTKRFPLESHQLRFYLESTLPAEQVVFVADTDQCGYNENLDVAGYDVTRHAVAVTAHTYATSHGDPEIKDAVTTSEFITALEVNRADIGLYAKCFIALIGTLGWVLVTLFLSTYHKIDPLGMIPGSLFGTVANIMVGAGLLPDALQMGLLEYTNTFGIMIILMATVAIINVNSSRNHHEDKAFADSYSKLMFYTILVLTVVGNIVLPLSAYAF